ncbi:MAG: extracellular solute-binding protein [Planctomycetaceae bacterium]
MRFPIALPLAGLLLSGCFAPSEDALVVYCAHDANFSQQVLEDFERETGIAVDVRFDTEATKSLGLVNLIIREANAPRCDVFWNNQTLGTIDLANRGLLETYKGPGYERIPDRYKDPAGLWCGFAGRLRVWIVNTNEMPADRDAIETAFRERLADFTYAKPMFGTTLSHYCVLASELGLEELQSLDERFRETATTAASNGQTRDLVAAGTCAFGWTDTDDYFGAIDNGKPVGMSPVEIGEATICIPNSVGIVKGTKRRAQAERLVDYLLSREVELRLANSESRQIPLGDVGDAELPEEVGDLVPYAARGVDLSRAAERRTAVLEWLMSVYAN